jgi:iron-sulfur cluster assembly accessory protein
MTEQRSKEPVVQLTPRAVEEIQSMQLKPENAGKSLRVYVEQGGCSGMQYSLVFDEWRDGDQESGIEGVSVLVDGFSAKYLRGAVVDFSDSLTSGGFKITNPNARESCGCGKSFTT